jgi:hypothetical protein
MPAPRSGDAERRVRTALAGASPDGTPVALWGSLPWAPPSGEGYVRQTLEFDAACGSCDLLKLANGLPLFAAGAESFGWEAERLRDLVRIGRLVGDGGVPRIETVPGVGETLRRWPQDDPERLAKALAAWAWAAVAEGGCAGVMLVLPEPEWSEADAGILKAARDAGGWCQIVHFHGPEAPPNEVLTQADGVSGPWKALVALPETLCRVGGINERRLARRPVEEVGGEARRAEEWAAQARCGLILAPGCAIPPGVSGDRLRAVRDAAKRVSPQT